jgi:hypothetical protein
MGRLEITTFAGANMFQKALLTDKTTHAAWRSTENFELTSELRRRFPGRHQPRTATSAAASILYGKVDRSGPLGTLNGRQLTGNRPRQVGLGPVEKDEQTSAYD